MNKIYWVWDERDGTIDEVKQHVGAGWGQLLDDTITKLFDNGWDGHVVQVKEKFGGLRFYVGKANDACHKIIQAAEDKSYHICEECGAPGKQRNPDGWIFTACDAHKVRR